VIRDGLRNERQALKALPHAVAGFWDGLQRRDPIASAEVSRTYRHNFESFASPWWVSRPLPELIRALPAEMLRGSSTSPNGSNRPPGRRDEYYATRAKYYPDSVATLKF
jgi:hypothetical protein